MHQKYLGGVSVVLIHITGCPQTVDVVVVRGKHLPTGIVVWVVVFLRVNVLHSRPFYQYGGTGQVRVRHWVNDEAGDFGTVDEVFTIQRDINHIGIDTYSNGITQRQTVRGNAGITGKAGGRVEGPAQRVVQGGVVG